MQIKRKFKYPSGVLLSRGINTPMSGDSHLKRKNKPKFSNVKTEHNGLKFDSKAERKYYELHKDENMKFQVEFLLQESFRVGSKTYRSIKYKADFVFYDSDGQTNKVVDVKGARTEVFNIKAKIFVKKYGIPLFVAVLDSKTGIFLEKLA
ncbi:DUF1064 domain-containing protein [Vagococcus intermedius]|uniref:DUF1064 domain-containing protein n=1 Tax=Vagococcus intermedius TaxID=2991418 RepID=A0AAF0CWN9_9ENTE|nr:DUF1064 domain-containing protein [Vagococcus intermedius]WEG74394.1 DUF1064 domain-containing protein [Vagococcus intermedius]WEG76515.1 DUF1064 domain-containing protein [Vagococcus intermedius]